ncbi:MAG: MaoC family dehydratase N-terminal domain-containing protein [Pseudomonadota bacterium]
MTQLEEWVGKTRSLTEIIDERQAGLLAATLDQPIPLSGEPLPSCWHWAWFNDALSASQLGRDGHPKRGDFIPPVALPRRMWAGGNIEFINPVRIGSTIRKISTIKDVSEKQGNSGKLCIVSIGHQLVENEMLCIDETQNLVFREDPGPGTPATLEIDPPAVPDQSFEIHTDPVMMFRYSALTFNGHRIHYDVDYARDVEGYPDLVFHAPLTATTLCRLAQEMLGEVDIKSFHYRATAPLFCNQTVGFSGKHEEGKLRLWAQTPAGGQAMLAEAIG